MAEGIIIEGIKSGVPKWATEKTASEILENLETMNSKMAGDIAKKLASAMDKIFDSGKISTESQEDLSEAMDSLTLTTKDLIEEKGRELKSTERVNKAREKFSKGLKHSATLLSGALGFVSGTLYQHANNVLEVSRAGIDLYDSIEDGRTAYSVLSDSVLEANVSFGQMIGLTKQYTSVINQFGIRDFSRASRHVNMSLGRLGITSQESADLVAEYLNSQRMFLYRSNLSENQRLKSAESAIDQMNRWGKVLGASREEMAKGLTETLEQVDVSFYLKNATDPVRESMRSLATMMSGDEFKGMSKAIVSAVADPYFMREGGLYQSLAEAGAAEVGNAIWTLQNAINSGADEFEIENHLRKTLQLIDEVPPHIALAMGPAADTFKEIALVSGRWLNLSEEERMAAQAASIANQAAAESMAAMSDVVTRLKNAFAIGFSEFFNNTDDLETLSKSITTFARSLSEVISSNIIPRISSAMQFLVRAFDSMFKSVDNWISSLDEGEDPIEALGALIKDKISGVFDDFKGYLKIGLGVIVAAVVANIALAFKGIMTSMAATKTAGAIGGFGKAIGAKSGGLIASLARGLAMAGPLAKPILLGATAISGAIVLIGGAIAGAAWMTGATLPKFTESLKGITEVDGDKLASLASGLGLFTGALVAFTAGSLGSSLMSMGSKIVNFFTGGGPMSEIAKMGEAADKHADNINTLANSLETISSVDFGKNDSLKTLSSQIVHVARAARELDKVKPERNLGVLSRLVESMSQSSTPVMYRGEVSKIPSENMEAVSGTSTPVTNQRSGWFRRSRNDVVDGNQGITSTVSLPVEQEQVMKDSNEKLGSIDERYEESGKQSSESSAQINSAILRIEGRLAELVEISRVQVRSLRQIRDINEERE